MNITPTQTEREAVAQNFVNKPAAFLFPQAANDISGGICPECGEFVVGFRNELSKKEWTISGMCQQCQDNTYGIC